MKLKILVVRLGLLFEIMKSDVVISATEAAVSGFVLHTNPLRIFDEVVAAKNEIVRCINVGTNLANWLFIVRRKLLTAN